MRKAFTVLLLCALALTSCNTIRNASVDENVNDKTDISNVFYISGELPEIGDFSGKQKKHFYGEYTPEFVPSTEYGLVLPYVGSYKVFKSSDMDSWNISQGYASYGFCLEDGTIVMDASEENEYLHYNETDDGFGYYTLTRNTSRKTDAPDEYMPGEQYVIPESGKWCMKLEKNSYVSTAGSGYICISSYVEDKTHHVFYDYDGKEVFSLDNCDIAGSFSCGLAPVYSFEKREDGNYISDRYFINEKGEFVLGPYSFSSSFNKYGVASVEDFDGNCYLINTFGEEISVGEYESIYCEIPYKGEGNTYFVARYKDKSLMCDIYDGSGDFIGTAQGSRYCTLRFPDNGRIIYNYTDDANRNVYKYLDDSSDFVSKELGVSPNRYESKDNLYIYVDDENDFGLLFDGDGETVARFDDFCDFLDVDKNSRFVAYTTGDFEYKYDELSGESTMNDTRSLHLYDVETKELLFTAPAGGYVTFYGENDRFVHIYTYDETNPAFAAWEGTKHYLYDLKQKKLIFSDADSIECREIDGKCYFYVCSKNVCATYDSNLHGLVKEYNE